MRKKLLDKLKSCSNARLNSNMERRTILRRFLDWVGCLVYTLLLNVLCLPSYFSRSANGFKKAQQATCGYLQDSYDEYRKRRKRFVIASSGMVIAASMFNLPGIDPLWQQVLRMLGDTRNIQSSEFFDGNDWEIQAWDFLSRHRTNNMIDDRNISSMGPVAVWQRLTNRGWEIVSWSLVDEQERQLTNNAIDDINPITDGQYVVWRQRQDSGIWSIMLQDLHDPDNLVWTLSSSGTADEHDLDDGIVVWMEWIEGDWEIMVRRPNFGSTRITYNNTPDISPSIEGQSIYWEGIDPSGGDTEIYRFDLSTQRTETVTANDLEDDAPEIVNGLIQWFERRVGVSARMEFDESVGRSRLLDLFVAPQAPIIEHVTEAQDIAEEAQSDTIEIESSKQTSDTDEQNDASGVVDELPTETVDQDSTTVIP